MAALGAAPSAGWGHLPWSRSGDPRGSEVREEYKELVRLGGATYECCPAEGGRKALHDVLAKAESKGKQPVLVADDTTMKAVVGQAGWDGFVEEAARYCFMLTIPRFVLTQ